MGQFGFPVSRCPPALLRRALARVARCTNRVGPAHDTRRRWSLSLPAGSPRESADRRIFPRAFGRASHGIRDSGAHRCPPNHRSVGRSERRFSCPASRIRVARPPSFGAPIAARAPSVSATGGQLRFGTRTMTVVVSKQWCESVTPSPPHLAFVAVEHRRRVRSLVRVNTDHHLHRWVLSPSWKPVASTPDSKDRHAPVASSRGQVCLASAVVSRAWCEDKLSWGCCSFPRGGSAQGARYLAPALVAAGWSVELVTGVARRVG